MAGEATDFVWLHDAVVYLGAAVVTAPICVRIGASPILGYLLAGVALGPFAFRVIKDVEGAANLAELGVVLLMFTIGLELSFQRLRVMAKYIFGFGLAQVLLTSAGICIIARAVGLSWEASLLVGGALSLSSTALVLRLLAERGELQTRHGRLVFSALLFQDLAVAPMLAAAPLLALGNTQQLLEVGDLLQALATAIVAVGGFILIGRFALRPFLRVIAAMNNREVFAAASLLIVLATSWIGAITGLSMALGAFLAGMLLAGSGFRHQVEMEIVPFRGLLLGLFFMSIGALIDIQALTHLWREALLATLALIVFKSLVITGLARLIGFSLPTAIHCGLLLAQGGEFAFALASIAFGSGVLDGVEAQIFLLATAISLGLTPVLAWLGGFLDKKLEGRGLPGLKEFESRLLKLEGEMVIIGFGRAGQTLGRVLEAAQENFVAIDNSPSRVLAANANGQSVFFADVRSDRVLRTIAKARPRLVIIAIGDADSGIELINWLQKKAPDIKIYARAADQTAQENLISAGAEFVVREVAESSLHMGGEILRALGRSKDDAASTIDTFRQDEYQALSSFIDPKGERYGKNLTH